MTAEHTMEKAHALHYLSQVEQKEQLIEIMSAEVVIARYNVGN